VCTDLLHHFTSCVSALTVASATHTQIECVIDTVQQQQCVDELAI
jgi:hypothetical protein